MFLYLGYTVIKAHFFPCSYTLALLPARRYASDRNVSVRLSRAGIVSKRRKLAA